MESIVLVIPPEIASQIKLPPGRARQMIMQELVLRLYQERIISSGQSAYLLNMDRMTFERFLAEHAIPMHSDPQELEQDILSLDRAI
jgi:predicted HTH domain antitoxin